MHWLLFYPAIFLLFFTLIGAVRSIIETVYESFFSKSLLEKNASSEFSKSSFQRRDSEFMYDRIVTKSMNSLDSNNNNNNSINLKNKQRKNKRIGKCVFACVCIYVCVCLSVFIYIYICTVSTMHSTHIVYRYI